MTAGKRIRAGLLAAMATVLVACGGTAGVGAPTGVGTSTVGTPTVSTSGTPLGQIPYDQRATSPVIMVDMVRATVAGIVGQSVTVLYGDGTLLRPNTSGDGWTVSKVSPEAIDKLLAQAAADELLTAADPGEPGVSDQGWTVITVNAEGRTFAHRMYAPGFDNGLTQSQLQVRARLNALAGKLSALSGADLVEQPAPYQVRRIGVRVTSAADLPEDADPVTVRWPSAVPVRELFGATGCAELSGDRMTALLALRPPSADPRAGVLLTTGLELPRVLRVRITSLLPHQSGCADRTSSTELPAPWPGENRRAADSWHEWIGHQVVVQAAAAGRIGSGARTVTQLSWFNLSYSMADVAGRTVLDIHGKRSITPRPPGDVAQFDLRADPATGEVIEVRAQ